VYQQLYDIDLRADYTKLDVPVYFFLGRHDVNAPVGLVENMSGCLTRQIKGLYGLSIPGTAHGLMSEINYRGGHVMLFRKLINRRSAGKMSIAIFSGVLTLLFIFTLSACIGAKGSIVILENGEERASQWI
jgi:hypothetical protein